MISDCEKLFRTISQREMVPTKNEQNILVLTEAYLKSFDSKFQ